MCFILFFFFFLSTEFYTPRCLNFRRGVGIYRARILIETINETVNQYAVNNLGELAAICTANIFRSFVSIIAVK